MHLDSLKPFIAWLHLHPEWGWAMAFLFAFLESLAIIGLVVPGSVIMAAMGLLIGSGVLPAASTISWAIIGAFVGDMLSYLLGYYYCDRIRSLWLIRLAPRWLEKSERFFERHGGKSIFIGRFVGAIRPLLPIIAGMLNMKPSRFIMIDAIAAVVWAPAYMLPGLLIGAASIALAPDFATRIIIHLIVVLLLIWLTYWLIKKIMYWVITILNRLSIKLWQVIQTRVTLKPICILLQKTHVPDDHSQLVIAVGGLVCLIAFIILTIGIIQHNSLMALNVPLYHFFRSLYQPALQKIMVAISFFGNPKGLLFFWLGVFIYLLWKRYWFVTWHWVALGLIAFGLTGTLKRFIASPRPIGLLQTLHSGSYPSGHSTLSTAFFGFLAVLVTHNRNNIIKWLTYGITIIFILLIALTRLFLTVHWFTDVAGGVLLGLAIVLAMTVSYRRISNQEIAATGLVLIALVCLAISFSLFCWRDFNTLNHDLTPQWPQYTMRGQAWWREGIVGTPLIRHNRFYHPMQTINVEWYGDLKIIEKSLTRQGWKKRPTSKLVLTLNFLGTKERNLTLPLFPTVYEDRSHVLAMTKLIGKPQQLLVLRLWLSDFNLRPIDPNLQLYVGTLGFNRAYSVYFLKHVQDHKQKPWLFEKKQAIKIFLNYLDAFEWKLLSFPHHPRINHHQDLDWDGHVVLIRPATSTDWQ